jgi:hypothetical protein
MSLMQHVSAFQLPSRFASSQDGVTPGSSPFDPSIEIVHDESQRIYDQLVKVYFDTWSPYLNKNKETIASKANSENCDKQCLKTCPLAF